MDKAELIRRLMATFVVELQDHVRVYNRELLALEQGAKGPAGENAVKTLFRVVHSLKGASRSVEALPLMRACHLLEELLSQLRDGTRNQTPELFAVLFQAADAIEATGKLLAAGVPGGEANAGLDALIMALNVVRAQPLISRQPPPPPIAAAIANIPRTPNIVFHQPSSPENDARAEPASSPAPPVMSSLPPPARPAGSDEHAVVRIPVRRLDALLAQSGELSVARRRLDLREEDLEGLYDGIAHVRGQFRTFRKQQQREAKLKVESTLSFKAQRMLELTDAALERLEGECERLRRTFADDVRNVERAAVPLEAQVHRVRMLPFAEACQSLARTVRDLAQSQHKQVELEIRGNDVELDRAVIECARVALMHLVQNAIDHGIEQPSDRERAGKPARASLRITAAQSGERVEIELCDDGRGLDLEALREQATRRGLSASNEYELSRLIFSPGFSTARTVSEISGRGVGLDVVRSLVEELRGEVGVRSEPGRGTTFTLQLPVTAGTLRALLVQVGSQVFALPSRNVQALTRAAPVEIGHVEGREVLLTATGPVALGALRGVLGLAGDEPLRPDGKLPIVVISADGRRIALAVDAWQSEQELLQKPLGQRVRQLRTVSAAALLPSGEIALLLKPHELVRSVLAEAARRSLSHVFEKKRETLKKRVLLADDSVTTRTLERSILEAAGYEVLTAADGEQAFKLLQEKGADVVVSDVEMPNMDGFMLTEAIRGSPRFKGVPVVLLTALSAEHDRARGLAAGADAYLVKSAFDQDSLLETLRQLT